MNLLDTKHRRPYWLETRRLVVLSMLPGLMIVFGSLIFMGQLNGIRFIGFPLGYFLLAHGFIIMAFTAIAAHAVRQDHIDRHHGMHEDN